MQTKEIFKQITELLLLSQSIDVSKFDDSFLIKSVQKRVSNSNCLTVEAYYDLLNRNIKEREEFINTLNISYSEFFRNTLTFSVLERIVLPSIGLKMRTGKRKEIRIWSAACAAGQETYSIAMLLEEMKSLNNKNINYRIFASDQDKTQVNEAETGQYSTAALNNLSLKRVNQWFNKQKEVYTVKPELKKNIDFSQFDLLNDQLCCPPSSIFGDFDIVVCANLLFYYKDEFREKIITKAGSCLSKGGYIITGETERNILKKYNYHEIISQSAIFQKIGHR